MAEREILIRKATLDDLNAILYLYTTHMFDSYLLKFGNSFIKKYLKIILNSKNCITLVATQKHTVGFIMAALNSKEILSRLFFNFEILSAWVKQVLLHPGLIFESLEFILYPLKTSLKNVYAEFLFIAIEPAYRKKSLATRLIKQVLDLMRQREIEKVKVTAVDKNEAVNCLLNNLGFKKEKRFKSFKKFMYLYSHDTKSV